MRATRRLLSAHRELWERAKRHPFLGLLERPPSRRLLRRWFSCETRWYERAMAALGCLLESIPRTHRYVLAQALVLLAEELDWLEVHAEPAFSDPVVEAWAGRVRGIFEQGWERAMVMLWLGSRLQYEAMRPLASEDELAREYLERRTSAVMEAFLYDFEELAETGVERLGLSEAGGVLLRVVEGLTALWDVGLRLARGQE